MASAPGEAITLKGRRSQFAVNCFPLSLGILYLFLPISHSFVLLAATKRTNEERRELHKRVGWKKKCFFPLKLPLRLVAISPANIAASDWTRLQTLEALTPVSLHLSPEYSIVGLHDYS